MDKTIADDSLFNTRVVFAKIAAKWGGDNQSDLERDLRVLIGTVQMDIRNGITCQMSDRELDIQEL